MHRRLFIQFVSIIIFSSSLLEYTYICCYYYFTDITNHPQSVNTTINSTVSFACEAVADEINFRVNDLSATLVNVIAKGFIQKPTKSLSGGKLRLLSAEALTDNNNTNISCKAVGSMIVYSDMAVLRIQGELML